MAYEEYPHSQFPDAVDNFDNMQDITATLVDAMVSYQTAITNKDFTAASAVISNYPDLLKVLINADRINSLQDAVKAIEQYYIDDVQSMITTLAANTVGINDNATGEAKKTNACSAEKTEYLSGVVIASNITIPIGSWDSNLTYTYSNSAIMESDRVEVDFASASILTAAKAFIYVQDDTGTGNITFQANKLPKSELTIKEIRLVRA